MKNASEDIWQAIMRPEPHAQCNSRFLIYIYFSHIGIDTVSGLYYNNLTDTVSGLFESWGRSWT